jgi:hypothetical protein
MSLVTMSSTSRIYLFSFSYDTFALLCGNGYDAGTSLTWST